MKLRQNCQTTRRGLRKWKRRWKHKNEAHRRSVPTMIYPGQLDGKFRICFKENKYENPIELLLSFERELELIDNELTDRDKI